ncbi:hypothetical protein PsAD46_03932 [Pseudovibrio sp. Ad46]|nr:hypothetical protein [Pseudovibrio sp. Ad46]KZK80884.1 hypothetical protein PsAD46_03932 [Pseudovibrio sp. Ad46]
MSLWEYVACVEGYSEAHGGKSGSPSDEFSDEDLRELGIEGF